MPPTMLSGSKARSSQESSLRARPEPSCFPPGRRGSRSPPPWPTGTRARGPRRGRRGGARHPSNYSCAAPDLPAGRSAGRTLWRSRERVEAVIGGSVLERRDARDLLELVVERGALEGY